MASYDTFGEQDQKEETTRMVVQIPQIPKMAAKAGNVSSI